MKGKILGFDAAVGTGAITGDDGKRYSFAAAENKSSAALKAGDAVDFQVDGDAAKDIYAVAGAASVDLAAMAANPAVANVLAKPNIIWAGIIILGALVANYIGAVQAAGRMSEFASAIDRMGAAFGGGGGGGGGMQMGALVLYLLLVIPIMAGVLIFFELTNHKMTAQFRQWTAYAAIGGPILIPILSALFMGAGFQFPYIDLGFVLVVGGGVLILLTTMGIIKKLG
jgi:hypothetical protein